MYKLGSFMKSDLRGMEVQLGGGITFLLNKWEKNRSEVVGRVSTSQPGPVTGAPQQGAGMKGHW